MTTFTEVDSDDLFSFFFDRKIYVEYFVETAFSEKFDGELLDIVGGCNDEYMARSFLHPGEECPKDTGGGFVAGVAVGCSGECFFDFVDPENAGCEGVDTSDGISHVFFGFSEPFSVDAADVEVDKRPVPECCDGFCKEGFSGTGGTQEEDSFGRSDTELLCFRGKGMLLLGEPDFEEVHAAEVSEGCGCRSGGESGSFVDEVCFFAEDVGDVPGGELTAFDDGNSIGTACFAGGEAPGCVDEFRRYGFLGRNAEFFKDVLVNGFPFVCVGIGTAGFGNVTAKGFRELLCGLDEEEGSVAAGGLGEGSKGTEEPGIGAEVVVVGVLEVFCGEEEGMKAGFFVPGEEIVFGADAGGQSF